MMADESIKEFIQKLASGAPTPGGGSAAALAGAMAAALSEMVCNLTIGKEKYASVEKQVEGCWKSWMRTRRRLIG
jgi:formiminotetrahydrofolate cyclodeaminase